MKRRAVHSWAALALAGLVSASLTVDTSGGQRVQDSELAEVVNKTLGLRTSSVVSVMINELPNDQVLAIVPIDDVPQVLVLKPYSVRSDNYRLLVQGADGALADWQPGPERTLRGSLVGVEGSEVAGSMLDDGLYARIFLPQGQEYWLEPIRSRVPGAANDDYVLYRDEDTRDTGATCGLDLLGNQVPALRPGNNPGGGDAKAAGAGGGNCIAELACDADVEYFQFWGSVTAVEDRINAVINTMNLQYEQDVSITHLITAIIVRTAEPDPYHGKKASQLLGQFRDEWETNQTAIQRDLAQFFTGRDLAGTTIGVAYVGTVCTNTGYNLVQSDFNNNFACATDLSAHELGHNWGAGHCGCPDHTMNPVITCANQFHPTLTIPEIVAFRDSRTCLDNCGVTPVCGNGLCEPGEDPCNCPQDCGAPPDTETSCSNGVDDDCDGLVDCEDPDCSGDPGCQGTSAIVDCITYTTHGGPGGHKHMDITVTIVDDSNNPIAGATVLFTLTTSSQSWNGGATTNADGIVIFSLLGGPDTCYTSDVTDVSGPGLIFSGAEPTNGFLKGTDPTPDADCRSGSDPCGV